MKTKCPNCSSSNLAKKEAKDFNLLLESLGVAIVGFFLLPAWYGILVLIIGLLGGLLALFTFFASEAEFKCRDCGYSWSASTKKENVKTEEELEEKKPVKNPNPKKIKKTGEISIKIANEELASVFEEFKQQSVTNYKQAKNLCSKYDIHLEKLKQNYKFKGKQALGVISGWLMEDSVILFDDFFLCYTTTPYLANYEKLNQNAGWLNKNKFNGEFEYLYLSKEEKIELKNVIENTETVS